MPQSPLDEVAINLLKERIFNLEKEISADCVTFYGPIMYGVEQRFNQALKNVPKESRRKALAVILDTPGGIVEVTDRMVQCTRHFYQDVYFIVPNAAMSAGTVFAMSGDKIYMNYFSILGPIDPQIQKEGKFIPALSYLSEYEDLIEKSEKGKLSTAEYALLGKLDLGELHTFKQAKALSIELLELWLSNYKFKDWVTTETTKTTVDSTLKKKRAQKIGEELANHQRWHSHSKGISMDVLRNDLNLKIEDYGTDANLNARIHEYFDVFVDFLSQKGVPSFVHSGYYY